MTVLALTIFISTALVCFFLMLFVASIANGQGGAQESLLPLNEDLPAAAATPKGGETR